MTKEEKWLLDALTHVLNKTQCERDSESNPDWNGVLATAQTHAVLSLLDPFLEEEKKGKWPENVTQCIRNEALKMVRQNYHLLYLTAYLIAELKKGGVDTVLLKGASVAEYYPVPELRKSGDVDLLLLDPTDQTRAGQILSALQIHSHRSHSVNHHTSFRTQEGIDIEIHTMLVEPLDDRAANQKIELVQKRIREEVCVRELMGMSLPVLKEGIGAYHLLLHMLHHFLHTGFGLKLLCDWVVLWNHGVVKEEKEKYLNLVSESGLTGFSDIVTSVCVSYLGLKREVGEQLQTGAVSQKHKEELLREVLCSTEFGNGEDGRMVALRGTSFADLWREFHHQMHINFPKAGKCPVIWPFLWIFTLVRFLVNNRTVRRTTAGAVIRHARKRGNMVRYFHLFEKKE